jgi:hypothetical protein
MITYNGSSADDEDRIISPEIYFATGKVGVGMGVVSD